VADHEPEETATMDNDSNARNLERLIKTHGEIASLALEILKDDNLEAKTRRLLAAAAKYTIDEQDLVPDKFPVYGLVDDLFVLAQATGSTLEEGGDATAGYQDRKLGGEPVMEFIDGMRDHFYGFWEFCRQQSQTLLVEAFAKAELDEAVLKEIRDEFEPSVAEIREKTREVTLDPDQVAVFLAQFRSVNLADLD
ncbi:DUF1232 domain-containing protein, partial [Planctomycetota bacterium]